MQEFRNLIFEGGGVWGIAYEGVLSELQDQGAIDFGSLGRLGGASAGAICACLLSVGFKPDELGTLLKETDFSDFKDDSFGFARDTTRLLTEYGWYKGNEFKRWIRRNVRDKIKQISEENGINRYEARPTFSELASWHRALSKKGVNLPALYVVGSNLSQQRREIYSAERSHSPKMHIDDAVRRSMSIPMFFACARGSDRDVIVDGGLTWNYPINLFDHEKYLSSSDKGQAVVYAPTSKYVFNTETLGVRLDTTKEMELNIKDWRNKPIEIDNIVKYGWALATFIRAIANKSHLHKNDWTRTLFVDVGEDIGFTDFDLSEEDKDFLVEAGRKGVREYLKWYRSKRGQKEIEKIYRDVAPDEAA